MSGARARCVRALHCGGGQRWRAFALRWPALAAVLVGVFACAPGTFSSWRAPPAWDRSANQANRIPGGQECLEWLERLGIQHRRLSAKPGVGTPVVIEGPIGGIRFFTQGREELVCDCRLVLALDWSARLLQPMGVQAMNHSGAYVYRTTRSGRPSLHARGLAIDVHGIQVGEQWFWVKKDYQAGLRDGCKGPVLNDISCRLRHLRLFRELITPDHNSDHHDHFHLGIPPLG